MSKGMDLKIMRARILEQTRKFFWKEGFIETDTPALVMNPGMEPHIRPVEVKGLSTPRAAFLHTSPEFAMKKLLASGDARLSKIFQICKCYRLEPASQTHHPEFTMIEWYRTDSGYEQIMQDVEHLFRDLALSLFGKTDFQSIGGKKLDVAGPWPRLSIEECFRKYAGLELTDLISDKDSIFKFCKSKGWTSQSDLHWDDYYFLIWMNLIEPQIASQDKPVIVHLYPESQASLSNLVTDSRGFKWAKRFEVYAGGLELGNAFDELTDAKQQRSRFEKDMELRRQVYGPGSQHPMPVPPMDEEFLEAVGKLKRSGGIAMGMDRIIMLFTGCDNINDVLWQKSNWE